MLHQRSKAMWLQAGDQISKYFHTEASHRRKKNYIKKLQDDSRRWKQGEQRYQLIVEYFKTLFSSSNQRLSMDIVSNVGKRVSGQMNGKLSCKFIEDEVILALKQMHPTKAPGLDEISQGAGA